MGDEERGQPTANLEPPSLFRRKKREKARAPARSEPPAAPLEDAPDEPTIILDEPVPVPRSRTSAVDPAAPLFVDEVAPRPEPSPVDAPAVQPAVQPAVESSHPRKTFRRPGLAGFRVNGWVAVILTGAVVGVLMVVATDAALGVCESVQGTSSCGTPGFLLLVAILIAMIVVGGLILRVCRVVDPGSTSFLAVGLLAVLVLLFLLDVVMNWWIILVIPALAVVTFVLAHWVTTAVVSPAER